MRECIFCNIANKLEPASIIVETDTVLAIMSLFPFAQGHCLVIPKQHANTLQSLDEAVGRDMFTHAQRLAQCVAEVVTCDWVQLMMHDDLLEGQHMLEPFHLHLHVLPRTKHITYSEERPAMASRQQLDALARELKTVYTQRFY